jgi:hypothetical protein
LESATWSPRRLTSPGLAFAALLAALSLLFAPAAWAQNIGADDTGLVEGGGPGEPGEDGADSAGGGSGDSGTNSRGNDGFSSKGASARGTQAGEILIEEEPATAVVIPRSSPRANKKASNRAPIQQPTADLMPGQQPAPIGSGPAETLVANQPPSSAESTGRDDTLAWLLTLAGALLALVLLLEKLRGEGKTGRRSLRDATA